MMLLNCRTGCINMPDLEAGINPIIGRRDALQNGGTGMRFQWRRHDQTLNGIAIAFEGQVYAYQNACPHRGTELDWQPGEVFDETGLYLVCATHGAMFEPKTGVCISGPCRGAHLLPVNVAVENRQIILLDDIRKGPDS